MLRKYATIILIGVANMILLGHDIIPHQHHDHGHHHARAHHHGHDHDHDSDSHNDGLNHLFAHFIHSSEDFSFALGQSVADTFSKEFSAYVALLPVNYSLDAFQIAPIVHSTFAERVVYISPYSHPSGLRAPPAFIS